MNNQLVLISCVIDIVHPYDMYENIAEKDNPNVSGFSKEMELHELKKPDPSMSLEQKLVLASSITQVALKYTRLLESVLPVLAQFYQNNVLDLQN